MTLHGTRQSATFLILPALLALAALLFAGRSAATVLRELSFEELVAESALIFQGTVLRHEVSEVDGLVHTEVVFRVGEVLKGEVGEAGAGELSLRFVGGAVPNHVVEVAGQYIPSPGDHGLYFVAQTGPERVNPLAGWHQGAFLIDTVDGRAVLDLRERPDLIRYNSFADPLAEKMLNLGFSEQQISEKVPLYQRFPLQDFKDAVRDLVDAAAP